jgi:hypothetical protein
MKNRISINPIALAFVSVLLAVVLYSCGNSKPDELFYKKADILDIKRDDEGEYHLLVRYEDGTTESVADVRATIKMGDYRPKAGMPFVKWDNGNKKGTLEGWRVNSTDYSYMDIQVYLPLDYKIELFND